MFDDKWHPTRVQPTEKGKACNGSGDKENNKCDEAYWLRRQKEEHDNRS